jgi:hypothetical protein
MANAGDRLGRVAQMMLRRCSARKVSQPGMIGNQ